MDSPPAQAISEVEVEVQSPKSLLPYGYSPKKGVRPVTKTALDSEGLSSSMPVEREKHALTEQPVLISSDKLDESSREPLLSEGMPSSPPDV